MPESAAYTDRPLLYVDLGSPYAYLTVERIADVLPQADWQSVALGAIFKATGRDSWGAPGAATRAGGQAEVERRAAEYGLPPIRWPERWPNNGLQAARAAVWAATQRTGDAAAPQHRASSDAAATAERRFIREALRLQFRDAVALDQPGAVAEALRRADLNADAGLAATQTPEIKLALRARTDAALQRGVFGVPSVAVGPFVLWGDDQLAVAAQLAAHHTGGRATATGRATAAETPRAGNPR